MISFVRRYLDPADRLGEILFGLIMALGFTGAVRLGQEKADNRALFTGVLGCNLAWAIVDGVMFVLTELFERGRKTRLARDVLSAASDEAALRQIAGEIDGPLIELTTPRERDELHRWILEVVRRESFAPPRVRREDVLGAVAVALVILVATLPIVVPFLVVPNADRAVRLSNAIAVTLLFLLACDGDEWSARSRGASARGSRCSAPCWC